jgi:hypothetical protein
MIKSIYMHRCEAGCKKALSLSENHKEWDDDILSGLCGSQTAQNGTYFRYGTCMFNALCHKVHLFLEYLECLSPRPNCDPSNPTSASECVLPPEPKEEGTHSPAGEGVGEGSNSDDWIKSLALCLLCALCR